MDHQDTPRQTLHRIPWFNELTPTALEGLASIAELTELAAGEVLFSEGDAENCLYILLDGEVELRTHAPGFGSVVIFIAEPLDVIGWSALTPVVRQRTDTATACSACSLVSFNSDLLRQVCDEDYATGYVIMRRIANVAASRLLTTRLHLFEVIRTQSDHSRERNKTKPD
jgi:CRP/FNR family cyclic AMP-dependent transcriptional regulator